MEIVPDKKDETLLFAIIGFIRLNGIKSFTSKLFNEKDLFLKLNVIQKENLMLMMKNYFYGN